MSDEITQSLVLGGTDSGKSSFAESLVIPCGLPVVYVATMDTSTSESLDQEMQARLERHRLRRPNHWSVIEAPRNIADCIRMHPGYCILIDSLSMWVTNLLSYQEAMFIQLKDELLEAVNQRKARVILVSSEVGCTVTPINAITRKFIARLGNLHIDMAKSCDEVINVQAGLPLWLKRKQQNNT